MLGNKAKIKIGDDFMESKGVVKENAGGIQVDRRTFVKGTAAVAMALGVGGFLDNIFGQQVKAHEPAPRPTKWDEEFDVVVVGSGTGALAAMVAKDAGFSAVILEKAATWGGTTAISGGVLWVPNNYLMKEAGIEDSLEEAFEYMKKASFGQSSDELIHAYIDNANPTLDYLVQNGHKPKIQVPYADYYHGSIDHSRKLGRSVIPPGLGRELMRTVRAAVDARGIPVYLQTPAVSLITDESGAVVGVWAKSPAKGKISIRARRGVLLATGGFDHNKEMREHFLPGPVYYPSAVPTDTGDGILMGMAIGADLRNMNEVWGWPVKEITIAGKKMGSFDGGGERAKPGSIYVNRFGQRFCNESANYDATTRNFYWWDNSIMDWRNIPAFCIVDSEYRKRYKFGRQKPGVEQPWMNRSDTLEELAGKLGIDAEGLMATVERVNIFAEEGVDRDFHRGEKPFDRLTYGDSERTDLKNPCLGPIKTPPFYGVRVYPGSLGTCGGLRINGNSQVLTPYGKVIDGLYAAGNTAGSPAGAGYPGAGATLGAGMIFARIAALHMAKKN